jgi:hypothetical protein
MNNPIFVYASCPEWKHEEKVVSSLFKTTSNRFTIKSGDLIIPRFSCLPYYGEQEIEYNSVGANMINSYEQHLYIADLKNWYYDLSEFTPRTYTDLSKVPNNIPLVLKGETNSKKFLWNTHMFASNKKEAIETHSKLLQDGLLSTQSIYFREYVPLETFEISFHGLPITREYRFFIYKSTILSGGYYWSSHMEYIQESNIKVDPNEVPVEFLNKIISKIQNTEISEPPVYYVIDVAKTLSGEWIVIELNDGSMSGLSENDPEVLYSSLKRELVV